MSTMAKVSASQLAARRQYLDNLDSFLDKCQADVVCLLDTLGWTPDNFMQVRKQAVCPYNSGHRMPPHRLEQHKRVCQFTSQGCSREDVDKILDDSDYFYEGASAVFTLKLDKDLMNSALWNYHMKQNSVYYGHNEMPLTQSHEEQMLGREDRLGLAEYIVQRARAANKLKEMGPDELQAAENMTDGADKGERQLTVVEEMSALRDFRRRRQTYRAKNVHITKKSHTEIMREVITNQMEMYSQSLSGAQSMSGAPFVSGSQSMSGAQFVSGSQSVPGARSLSGQVTTSQPEARGDMDKEDQSGDPATTDRYKVSQQGTYRERLSDQELDTRYRDRNRGHDRDRGDKDRDRDDRERRRRDDDRRHRSRSKRSESRSRQSSRSRSRDRHRSKHHKKHKKHKHKHRHRDSSGESGMDTETPKQAASTDVS